MKKLFILFAIGLSIAACNNESDVGKNIITPKGCDSTGFHDFCDSIATAWGRDLTQDEIQGLADSVWCPNHPLR